MTRRSGAAKEAPKREAPPLSREAQILVDRARSYGEQGRLAIQDFFGGNAVLGTHSYPKRLERLTLDLLDLEGGDAVFVTARGVPEYAALLERVKRSVHA